MSEPKDTAPDGGGAPNKKRSSDTSSSTLENGQQSVPQMSLSSDEINYLVFRYLQESGFVHSAFSFSHESMLGRSGLRAADRTLPAGALVTFIQKGLQYVGIEESLYQERARSEKSKSRRGNSNKDSNNSSNNSGVDSNSSTMQIDFSILSPAAISAINRKQPPIQLNVSAATAAAAVKARLETEAKLRSERDATVASAARTIPASLTNPQIQQQPQSTSHPNSDAVLQMAPAGAVAASATVLATPTPTSSTPAAVPPMLAGSNPMILPGVNVAGAPGEDPNPANSEMARHVLASQAVAAMNQIQRLQQQGRQQQQQNIPGAPTNIGVDAAAAILARQQHAADILAQQQAAALQQFAGGTGAPSTEAAPASLRPPQQQQQQQQSAEGFADAKADAAADAAATLATVAAQGGKRTAGDRPSSKRSNKKQKQSKQAAAPSSAMEVVRNTSSGNLARMVAAQQHQQQQQQQQPQQPQQPVPPAFASLKEAVARIEAGKKTPEPDPSRRRGSMQQAQDMETSSQQPQQAAGQELSTQHEVASTPDLVNGQKSDHHGDKTKNMSGSVSTLPKTVKSGSIRTSAKAASEEAGVSLPQQNGEKEQLQSSKNSNAPASNGASQRQQPPQQQSADTADSGVEPGDVETNAPNEEILKLEMHQSEVFMCAWNSVYTDLIATGSGDASARIWQMGGANAAAGMLAVKLLPHGSDPRDLKNKDVTTLEWSADGTYLATGSYDGVARVWARNGALIHTLRGHNGPIFSLKWNPRGNYLLSGSYDKTTIVWDVSGSTGFVEQQFTDHVAPALDVDWKDDTTFASCSTDKTVHICRVGVNGPLRVYSGHADEVNAVKWDPSGMYLASCSDDCTAKVWNVGDDLGTETSTTTTISTPMHDFKLHQQEIYTVKWSPTGPGSSNPNKQPMLATASFDGSVRLWNIQDGSCFRVFNRHRDSVYSVAFSPSGDFLASGSLAGQLYIWNIAENRHVKSYKGKGDIFEVAWNKEETRVAACFSSNVVTIIDFDRSNH